MARVVVVVSYDETEGVPEGLAITVANRVRPLFDGKQHFEVHLANGSTALHIVNTLADRRVR